MRWNLLPMAAAMTTMLAYQARTTAPPRLGTRSAPLLKQDGVEYKDLNRNGRLDGYEDWRRPPRARAEDLVRQMAVDDLAGVMVNGTLPATTGPNASIGRGAGYDLARVRELLETRRVNHFITRLNIEAVKLAEAHNQIQELAEKTKFGIPVTISTDPRNSFLQVLGASDTGGGFSQWPETTGLAAIHDPALTRRYADTIRREYLAVGIREALSPQADLMTEPRWPRGNGTFGEDAEVARVHVEAYVDGMQDGKAGLKPTSVITVVKHWLGYGAQKDGNDSHSYYGQTAVLSDSLLEYHARPFQGAFAARVAAVMPTYSILENVTMGGRPLERVGAGFSRQLLTELLRGKYGFQGVVVSDWAITNDCGETCRNGMPPGQRPTPAQIGMPWGVLDLPRVDRFAKAVNAGVDQIGGTEDVAALIDAAHAGKIPEVRMREAATRVLEQKFALGLFENPYVDAAAAGRVLGDPRSLRAGVEAQQRAMVPLENKLGGRAPLKAGFKVWLHAVDGAVARRLGYLPVEQPEQADLAIVRAAAPFETLHPGYFFGLRQHEGRLHFQPGDAAYDALLKCGKTPVAMTVYLDRPAILTQVKDKVAVLYGDFGVSDEALLGVLSGAAKAEGRLPFELPSSMEAVAAQHSGVPHDSPRPLYRYGYRWR